MSMKKEFRMYVNVPAVREDGEVVRHARNELVIITIDFDMLRDGIALDAAKNRTGRAVLGGGAIVAKLRK